MTAPGEAPSLMRLTPQASGWSPHSRLHFIWLEILRGFGGRAPNLVDAESGEIKFMPLAAATIRG